MKILIVFLFFSLFFSNSAMSAWDGQVRGKITHIEVTGGGNYDFRVSIAGRPSLCGNSHAWAYLNQSDSNYETYVSVLLASYMADREVRLYTYQENSSGQQYCHIGHITAG